MSYSFLHQERKGILVLSDQFDAETTRKVRPAIERFVAEHQTDLVIDLTRVVFMDSSAIGAIVFAFKRLSLQNRKVELVGVNGQPEALITSLRIDKTIPTTTLGLAA